MISLQISTEPLDSTCISARVRVPCAPAKVSKIHYHKSLSCKTLAHINVLFTLPRLKDPEY